MAQLINAKCPNCGAILELPDKLDRAFCMHCGGKVIIAQDRYIIESSKPAIACPECGGRGYIKCDKTNFDPIVVCEYTSVGIIMKIAATPCNGTGDCTFVFLNSTASPDTPFPHNKARGKCWYCKGTGRRLFGKCSICKGTGKCPVCNGTYKCYFCKGKGKVKCEACDGSGFKVYEGK